MPLAIIHRHFRKPTLRKCADRNRTQKIAFVLKTSLTHYVRAFRFGAGVAGCGDGQPAKQEIPYPLPEIRHNAHCRALASITAALILPLSVVVSVVFLSGLASSGG